jgi:nickel-dependent lactate racemase
MPSHTVLPVVLEELSEIQPADITVLVATGTHRPTTGAELERMVGSDVMRQVSIINHDAFDSNGLCQLPDVEPSVPVWLNRHWVDADVRIATGFVEPHFFAGFSGGPKMVAPGLAGFETTMRLHDAEMIGHTNARWGVTVGNPVHDAIRRIATVCGVDFSVDVTINRDRQVTAVQAGDLLTVHAEMCREVRATAMQPFASPFDVVVTTNSGYPLDQNLYQTIKGVSAAAQVVTDGGVILCASECSDGIPSHGEYGKILCERDSPDGLLEMIETPGYRRHDQWEVQVQAQVQRRAQVFLRADGLTDEQIRAAHLSPIRDIGAAAQEHLVERGPAARVCVLPEGPQTIPYLQVGPDHS